MTADRDRLDEAADLDLAARIADGIDVDWNDLAQQTVDDPPRSELHSALELIEKIGLAHESFASGGPETHGVPDDLGAAAPPAGGSADDLPASTTSWGHIEILHKIGEGSFGEVFEARETQLDRIVALKLLRPLALLADDAEEKILAEGRLLARIKHPHVATVFGADRNAGRVGLWMELVRGQTLDAIVKAGGPLGAREATLIGIDLCGALAAAHSQQILHRDVKAQNVMREQGGRIVLMDFGIGQDLRSSVPDGRIVGTPYYLAPEVLGGEPASPLSDLYSLGVLLFYLTTSKFPFEASSRAELMGRHVQGKRLPLRDARPELPGSFIRMVEKAISTDPDGRYASAGHFEEALSGTLTSSDLRGASGTFATPGDLSMEAAQQATAGIDPPSRLRALPAVGLLLAGLAVALFAWLGWRGEGERASAPGALDPTRIAILGFEDRTESGDQGSLASGVSEDLTDALAGISALDVVPMASSRRFFDSDRSVAGRELQAGTLLYGRVYDRFVSLEVIDAERNSIRWTDSWRASNRDLVATREAIVLRLVEELEIELSPEERQGISRRFTPSSLAHRLYLAGRGAWLDRRFEDAIEQFRQALDEDPEFLLPYTGLADTYALMAVYGDAPSSEALVKMKVAAERAVELNPDAAEGRISLGFARSHLDWDWLGAATEYCRALELEPRVRQTGGNLRRWWALWLSAVGRHDDAVAMARVAFAYDADQRLAAADRQAVGNLGFVLTNAGRFREAATELPAHLAGGGGSASAFYMLGRARIENGDVDSGLRALEEASLSRGDSPLMLSGLAWALARGGRHDEAATKLDALEKLAAERHVSPYQRARVAAGLARDERALELLRTAGETRDVWVPFLRWERTFDRLRDEAAMTQLVERIFPSSGTGQVCPCETRLRELLAR